MLRTLIPRQILAHPLSVTIATTGTAMPVAASTQKVVLSCRVVSSTEPASQTSQERPKSCRSHSQPDVWNGIIWGLASDLMMKTKEWMGENKRDYFRSIETVFVFHWLLIYGFLYYIKWFTEEKP